MNTYKVRIKSAKQQDWKNLKRAILGVSLGNQNERGDKLQAIVEWANANFEECLIDLSDTLYRWNVIDRDDHSDGAMAYAATLGDQWLEENKATLEQFTIPHTVIRWSEWFLHPQFLETYQAFHDLYYSSEPFRIAVNKDIDAYLNRFTQNVGISRENCLNFICEELAVYTLLNRTYPGTARLYPGSNLKAMEAVINNQVPSAPIGLQNTTTLLLRIERSSHFEDISKPADNNDKLVLKAG